MAKILQDIWEDVLTALRVSVPAERFNLWFRNTELLLHEGDSCEIGVPNAFVGEWIEEHFGEAVRGALGSVTRQDLRVRFVVSPALYRKTREEELRQKQELVEAIDSTLSKKTPSADAGGRSFCLEEFVVGASNRLAYAAALHVAGNSDLSLNPLVIHGAVGLGKTHLLRGICQRRNVPSTSPARVSRTSSWRVCSTTVWMAFAENSVTLNCWPWTISSSSPTSPPRRKSSCKSTTSS